MTSSNRNLFGGLADASDKKPNTLSGLAAALTQFAVLPEINQIWYNKKSITLDGYCFVECRFDGCELHVNSARFKLINCFIDSSTRILYGSDTLKPIRLFNHKTDWYYKNAPAYVPERDAEGRITLV